MYYLSDLDSGRVAARVFRGVERDDPQGDPKRRFERGGEEKKTD